MNIIWEGEMISPVDNFLVRLVGSFRAEWWIPDKALEHNGTQRPPVALVSVALQQENFRRNIVRGSDSRVSLHKCKLINRKGLRKVRTSFRLFAFHVAI